jgi:orotidine-5'-phosphate decarboxylase
MRTSNPADYICLALDTPSLGEAKQVLDELQKVGLRNVKCGYSLIHTPDGGTPTIATMLIQQGLLRDGGILDSKLDDTPETMRSGVLGIIAHGFPLFTVHLGAGAPSLRAVVESQQGSRAIGVTLLTSLEEQDLLALGFGDNPNLKMIVQRRIELGLECDITRFVCSPHELAAFRKAGLFGNCKFYVPGVRPTGAATKGQKRFMTPGQAFQYSPEMLLIGSPILSPAEGTRADAFNRICDEIAPFV